MKSIVLFGDQEARKTAPRKRTAPAVVQMRSARGRVVGLAVLLGFALRFSFDSSALNNILPTRSNCSSFDEQASKDQIPTVFISNSTSKSSSFDEKASKVHPTVYFSNERPNVNESFCPNGPVRHLAMCKDNLVYIYNPKCGSSSMRTILKGKEIEMSGFNTTGYFTFSMLRNPRERIVSAYATMMSRNKGMAGVCKGREFQAPPLPPADASMDTWHTHFISSVSYWIDTLEKKKLESRDCFWDSHLIPQIEFIRGFHLSWLGCLESVNQTYQQMNQHATTVHISPSTRKSNSYEHVKGMPKEKFQTLDVLPNSVIRRIDKVYAQDWELYRAICGSEG